MGHPNLHQSLIQIFVDVFLAKFVLIQVRAPVQRRPLWLVFEKSHGMNILEHVSLLYMFAPS